MKYPYFEMNKTYSFNGNEYIVSQITSYGSGLLFCCSIFHFSPKNDSTLPEITAMRWADGEIERFKRVRSQIVVKNNTPERHQYKNEKEQHKDLFTGFGAKNDYYQNMRAGAL